MKEEKTSNSSDMAIRHTENLDKLETELQQICDDIDNLLSSLVDSDADSALAGYTAETQKRANTAFENYHQRQIAIQGEIRKKAGAESKQEVESFISASKKDFISRLLCIANLMDALQAELLILSKESVRIQTENDELFSNLKNELPGEYLLENNKWLPGLYWLSNLYNNPTWRELLYHIHLSVGELNDYWRALQ